MKQNIESSNLIRIGKELERRLVAMRYSKETTRVHLQIFKWVKDYLAGYGETNYTKESGQRFLIEYSLQPQHKPSQFRNSKTVIHRLNEILENRQFAPVHRESQIKWPARFEEFEERYLEYLRRRRGLRENTITYHKRYAGLLLNRLNDSILSLEKLTAADLYNVFTTYQFPKTAESVLRCFFGFLFKNGITKTDLSVCVPKPRRPHPLPSVYSSDEVSRLLDCVNRSTVLGKRDYAMMMLAAHLGLRSVDIVNLSLKDIDYAGKKIEITQSKTSYPLTLVLNTNVAEAIKDYVINARPQTESDKIFLGSQAPFAPLTPGSGYTVARKYFDIAGIKTQGKRRGPHALRASYATALINKGTPYSVVKEALGHDDPESEKYYVRVDVRRLRSCAIDVPKPTGAFASALNDLEGVL